VRTGYVASVSSAPETVYKLLSYFVCCISRGWSNRASLAVSLIPICSLPLGGSAVASGTVKGPRERLNEANSSICGAFMVVE